MLLLSNAFTQRLSPSDAVLLCHHFDLGHLQLLKQACRLDAAATAAATAGAAEGRGVKQAHRPAAGTAGPVTPAVGIVPLDSPVNLALVLARHAAAKASGICQAQPTTGAWGLLMEDCSSPVFVSKELEIQPRVRMMAMTAMKIELDM